MRFRSLLCPTIAVAVAGGIAASPISATPPMVKAEAAAKPAVSRTPVRPHARRGAARPAAREAQAAKVEPPAPAIVFPPPIAVRTTNVAPQLVAAELSKRAGKMKPVYARRLFLPLWAISGNIGPEAESLIDYLSTSELDGLKPSRYKVDKLRQAVIAARSGDAKAIGKAELMLSQALGKYAADLRRRPKRDPAAVVYADPKLQPAKKPDEVAALRVGSLAPSFPAYIANMSWMSPHYRRMRALVAAARAQNVPQDVQRRIALNLERTRFLPGPFASHIVVDAAAGRLYWYEAGRQLGTMRVVVGKQASPTPMLVGTIHYAILNPYWNIPVDLVRTNTGPKVLSGRTLKSMNMEALSDWSDKAHVIDPATIDWNAVVAGSQELRVRQVPGPYNSMGQVKFMFPNELGIYLHDTSERELLAKDDRHFSNGCIRLEDAPGLGLWLLGRPLKSLSHDPELIVQLPAPVPVYITYLTATEGLGGVALLNDVYGRDGGTALARR